MTAGELLVRALWAAGVGAIYGAPLPGVEVVAVDGEVAPLMARAHERVHGQRAAIHVGDGLLVVPSSAPAVGSSPARRELATDSEIAQLAEALVGGAGIELRVALDLRCPTDVQAPLPCQDDHWDEPAPDDLERVRATRSAAVLCGPGVVRQGALSGLHELAAVGGLGVLNTWGCKGVFDWRSRHHWATVGLQRDDFVLGGLADVDLIIATGLDPLEAPQQSWALSPHVSVEPGALARLAEMWSAPRVSLEVPPLRRMLAEVTQAGWSDGRVPMMPSRVTLAYSQVFGAGGMVAADPGTAGFWVARAFATTRPGSVHVPAERGARGIAAACCLVARLHRRARAALAVVDAPVSGEVERVLEAAARLGVGVAVEVWDPEGDRLGPVEHEERLTRIATGGERGTLSVAVDQRQIERMIEVAGPVVAWS